MPLRRLPRLLLPLALLLSLAYTNSPHAFAQGQQPVSMTLQGSITIGISAGGPCIACVPPASTGSLTLTVDYTTRAVTGQFSGGGSGATTIQACDANNVPIEGSSTAQGTNSYSGTLGGAVDPASGAITASGTVQITGTATCVSGCGEGGAYSGTSSHPVSLSGVITPGGSGTGSISWSTAWCSHAGTWTAAATGIAYDSDRDGVADDKDACPQETANTPNGCPELIDGDRDGVPDPEDACPAVPADTRNGCPLAPDTDADGVPDPDDDCPAEYGPNADGCPDVIPDRDRDGFPDDEDACPDESASTEDGCPEPSTPEQRAEAIKDALLSALLSGEDPDLESIDGWEDLTSTQQENLKRIVERLRQMAESGRNPSSEEAPAATSPPETKPPVSSGWDTTPWYLKDEALRERQRQQQEQELKDKLATRIQTDQDIVRVVNDEKYREMFGAGYDAYRVLRDFAKPAYDAVAEATEWISDPEQAAQEAVQEWEQEGLTEAARKTLTDNGVLWAEDLELKTVEEVAVEAYKFVESHSATPAITHYDYYRKAYEREREAGLPPEAAHDEAMTELKNALQNPSDELMDSEDPSKMRHDWGQQYGHDPALLNAYNRAFPRLNGRLGVWEGR